MLRPNWFMGIYCIIVELSFECLVLFIHVRIMSLYCVYIYIDEQLLDQCLLLLIPMIATEFN